MGWGWDRRVRIPFLSSTGRNAKLLAGSSNTTGRRQNQPEHIPIRPMTGTRCRPGLDFICQYDGVFHGPIPRWQPGPTARR